MESRSLPTLLHRTSAENLYGLGSVSVVISMWGAHKCLQNFLFVIFYSFVCLLAQQQHWGLFSLTWPEYQTQSKCSDQVFYTCHWHRSSRGSSSPSGGNQAQSFPIWWCCCLCIWQLYLPYQEGGCLMNKPLPGFLFIKVSINYEYRNGFPWS